MGICLRTQFRCGVQPYPFIHSFKQAVNHYCIRKSSTRRLYKNTNLYELISIVLHFRWKGIQTLKLKKDYLCHVHLLPMYCASMFLNASAGVALISPGASWYLIHWNCRFHTFPMCQDQERIWPLIPRIVNVKIYKHLFFRWSYFFGLMRKFLANDLPFRPNGNERK